MSSGRQTGTVPKTKHNTRSRRDNTVNHMPNNLDWDESYRTQRARKESNTSASRHSDAGDDLYEENPWLGLAPFSHRADEDEMRWGNVKSSNLTPERSSALPNVDAFISANRVSTHRQENGSEERDGPSTTKEVMSRGRIKLKMEQSQRKIEELQQQQAALMSLRDKAIQQVKPVQVEESHQRSTPLISLRNKAVQQVKPVQEELERANIDGRLHNMQEYANIIQALERDEGSTNVELVDGQSEQQLRKKLNELMVKKAQVDNILAYIESDHAGDAGGSLSSDDGEIAMYSARPHGDGEDIGRREIAKQDNREQATAAYLHMKEMKLEEVKSKLEQLQGLLTRVERMRDSRPPPPRMNGETYHCHCSEPQGNTQVKNCPSNSVLEKLHSKKFELDHVMRKAKSNPGSSHPQGFTFNTSHNEHWGNPTVPSTVQTNMPEYSSDEAEADYDESPVKLCSSLQHSMMPSNSMPKSRSHSENLSNSGPHIPSKTSSGLGNGVGESRGGCLVHPEAEDRGRQQMPLPMPDITSSSNTALALQISQLQLQMEQMQMMYQNVMEKQQVSVFPPSQPWMPPNSPMSYMQYMPPTSQWHQHQLLINSLNQCCQLIWHQQRELAGLRQALTMLQEEGSMYKCPTTGYGNNLNFDAGLLWTQPSPQMLNNQVPPGNRANNYWDNFRSYSRQNLLSGRNKSNEGSLADTMAAPRTSSAPQMDNLRTKDNCCPGDVRANVPPMCRQTQRPLQLPNGPNRGEQNSGGRHRRFNTSNNLKPLPTDPLSSLEHCVYSELETLIVEEERSPNFLLQLLSELKSMRSHQQHNAVFPGNNSVPGMEGGCDLLDPVVPSYPQARSQQPPLMFDHEIPKVDTVVEEVGRMIEECDLCNPELLRQIVVFIMHAYHLVPQHDLVSRLEVSLLKFQGARIGQIGDELLCTIASVISHQGPVVRPNPHVVEDREVMVEHMEEEGAVGGLPLQAPKRTTSQSVETELAEADQPQHNTSENAEVFGIEEPTSSNIELDNQELPPREDNINQPTQDT